MKKKLLAMALVAMLALAVPISAFAASSPKPTPTPTQDDDDDDDDGGSSGGGTGGTGGSSSSTTTSNTGIGNGTVASNPSTAGAGQQVAETNVSVAVVDPATGATRTTNAAELANTTSATVATVFATGAADPAAFTVAVNSLATDSALKGFLTEQLTALLTIKGGSVATDKLGTYKPLATHADGLGNQITTINSYSGAVEGSVFMVVCINADGSTEIVPGIVVPFPNGQNKMLVATKGTPRFTTVLRIH